jgi:hypothetical protein
MGSPEPCIGDLVMLIARLVHQVRNHDPDNDVADKAMDYLRRHDLERPILREAMPTNRPRTHGERE